MERKDPNFKSPVDPTTFALSESPTIARLVTNADGSVRVQATVAVNPSKNPITASGSLGSVQVADGTVGTQLLAVDAAGKIGINSLPNVTLANAPGSPAVSASLLQATDSTTGNYTSTTLNPLGSGYKSVWIHFKVTTVTGTSATLTLNAVDPFSGDVTPIMQAGTGSAVSTALASGTSYDFLLAGSQGTTATTIGTQFGILGQGGTANLAALTLGPLLPFQFVVTKNALTVFSAKYSVVGLP